MSYNKKLYKGQDEPAFIYAGFNTNYNLSKNFTYREMIQSYTSAKYGINNSPNDEQLLNLTVLCQNVLQPIREKYGKSIKVNSGFRCKELNKKVGGADNSDHLYGAAADIKAGDGNNRKLFDLILNMVQNNQIKCRQLIWEYGTHTSPQWIHISINHKYNKEKKNQVVYLYNK